MSWIPGALLAVAGDGESATGWGVIYGVVGIAVLVGVIVLITRSRRGLGSEEGAERGPRAGDGAVVHHSSGETDFDGLAGTALPKRKDPEDDLPYPAERAAD